MISEVKSQFQLLQSVHKSIDAMIEGLDPGVLVKKPADGYNNIISLLAHLTLTEERFRKGISGGDANVDIMAPFSATDWNVNDILQDWGNTIPQAQKLFETLSEADLEATGMRMKSGDVLTKRQVITYMMIHAAHHRGQIPLLKRMLGV